MRYKIILTLLIAMLSSGSISAKRYNPYGTDWSFGFHFGGTAFFGDMRTNSSFLNNTPFSKFFYKDMRMMGGLSLDKWFGPYVGMTGNIQYGKIQGTKEASSAWFEANIFEYNLNVTANLSNILFGIDRRRHSLVYYSIGIGMTESRSWKYKIDTEEVIKTNGYGKPWRKGGIYQPMTEPIILNSLGIKLYIGNNLSLNIEGSCHIINSDKLDATPNNNSSFIAGVEGYTYYSLGMQYHFGWNGYHITNRYKHRARYNGGRTGYVKINPRKRGKKRKKWFKKRRRSFKFKRR